MDLTHWLQQGVGRLSIPQRPEFPTPVAPSQIARPHPCVNKPKLWPWIVFKTLVWLMPAFVAACSLCSKLPKSNPRAACGVVWFSLPFGYLPLYRNSIPPFSTKSSPRNNHRFENKTSSRGSSYELLVA